MNVSELARQLNIHPQKLLSVLPEFGFDIGAKAVKVDDRVAQQIQKEWRRIRFVLERREKEEREKEKQKEKELRKASGASISLPEKLTVRALADVLGTPVNALIVELMKNGVLMGQNENIDRDTATIIAGDLGFAVIAAEGGAGGATVDGEHVQALETMLAEDAPDARPPVIVVMGHVDHGKTKLLDAIRHANVVATEAGGITQHIGAYQVEWTDPREKDKEKNKKNKSKEAKQETKQLTFIDTPGHEAFTVMRSRGAKVADIAILVVAADDSVKPQTVEAINIIKAAQLPVVVAINKIDKPGADVQRVKSDLAQHSIQADDWGGDVPMIEISAKENKNIDKLLDTLLLVAEVNEENIKANAKRAAAGTVIEAHVDKGQGPVATVLVQTGTLHVNDPLVINGEVYGKVRALKDHRGKDLKEAPPSTPARILGFKIAPQVGDVLDLSNASEAKAVDVRAKMAKQTGAEQHIVSAAQEKAEEEGEHKTFTMVVKADTLGSLEAIVGSLERIKNEEVGVKVIGKGLGNITADDVARAQAANAIVYGFHVNTSPVAHEMLQKNNMPFRQYKVIYDLLDDVKAELQQLLSPELITTELGNAKILAIFRSDKKVMIAGARVESGKLQKDVPVRVKRDGEIIGLGRLTELQSGKQQVNEVPSGSECGLKFEGKLKLEAGDVLEAYKEEKKEKKLVLA
jgi:translation initiation factor IF-2